MVLARADFGRQEVQERTNRAPNDIGLLISAQRETLGTNMKVKALSMALAVSLVGAAASLSARGLPPNIEIFDIQGNGLSSTYAGQTVRIPDSVVTAVLADGFYLQTPDARADSDDSLTPNGIRVVTAGAPVYGAGGSVQVGHLVAATGSISEVGSETRLTVTLPLERIGTTVEPLPTAVEFSVASGKPRDRADNLSCFNNLSNFECFEGMRITMPTGRVATGNTTAAGDDFGPVYVSPFGERSLREKGLRFGSTPVPGNVLAGVWDGNPEVLVMDADRLGAVPNGTAIAGGASFTATGVLAVANGNYTLWPTTLNINAGSNTLPVAVTAAANAAMRVASFDLAALCDSTSNSPQPCSPTLPSTGQVTTQVDRLAQYMAEVLNGPEVVAVQNVENQAVLTQLAARLTALVPGSNYSGLMLEGTDPSGLDLAYLVDATRISGAAIEALGAGEIDPTQGGGIPLHRKPPLLLSATFNTPAPGAPQEFRVLNVYVADRTGVDAGTGSARERRFAQARSIAEMTQALQVPPALPLPVMVAGKFNAWNSTDGYVDVLGLISGAYTNDENLIDLLPFNIVSPLLRDSVSLLPVNARVTAVEVESFGALQGATDRRVGIGMAYDHVLMTNSAQQIASLSALGRGNADAPLKLREIGTGEVASSAFDAVVVDLEPNCRAVPASNTDGDTWCNLLDNCPVIANDDQLDTDGDLIGDVCDSDLDGDGVPNTQDNCPNMINPSQSDLDNDGLGDICDGDMDGDTVPNETDNCPVAANPGQEDFDSDGQGDACDPNADMVLSLSANPSTVVPGANFTATAGITHTGPQTVQTLILRINLPGQTTFQSINPGAWTCDSVPVGTPGATITCRRASMAPGNSQVSVTVQSNAGLLHGTQLPISAEVTPGDLNASNNAMTINVPVSVTSTDLRLVVFGPSPVVQVNDVLTFQNTINNLGQRGVTDLTFRVTRPAGTEFTAVTPQAGWSCSTASPSLVELVCTRNLDAGGQAQVAYDLTVLPAAAGTTIQVTGNVSSSAVPDPDNANNTVTLNFDVQGGGTLPDTIFADRFE